MMATPLLQGRRTPSSSGPRTMKRPKLMTWMGCCLEALHACMEAHLKFHVHMRAYPGCGMCVGAVAASAQRRLDAIVDGMEMEDPYMQDSSQPGFLKLQVKGPGFRV